MKERVFLGSVWASFVVTLFLWSLVLIFIAPEDLDIVGVLLFLVSLSAVVFTGALLFFYYVRIRLLKLEPIYQQVHVIFREAGIVACLITVSLILLNRNIMNGGIFLVLIVLGIFCEIFFLKIYGKGRSKSTRKTT